MGVAEEKSQNHYVSNPKFLQALKDYKQKREEAEQENKPIPRIPDYIGLCIQKIANNVSFKHQYKNYPFKEEMIGDGIENCIRYLHNFNPNKYSNPFAYFTTIIIYAFWRRILKEKTQLAIKNKIIRSIDVDTFELQEFDKDEDFRNVMKEFLQAHNDFDPEEKERKPRKKKESALEAFMDPEAISFDDDSLNIEELLGE